MSGGRLVVLDRLGRDVKRYSLPSGLVTLGSDPDCDIRVMLPTVSRHHATVVVRAHQTVIRNISDGRTLVNGQPVSVSGLQHGDTITLGDRSLRWEYDQPSAVKAVANQALYAKKGKGKTPRGRARASDAAARRVDPAVQLMLELNHRASMPGKQVAIVQPQRRENDNTESTPRLIVKPHRPYSQAGKRQRLSKPDPPPAPPAEAEAEAEPRRKSAPRVSPKADFTNTTKATLWIESRKSAPRKSATVTPKASPMASPRRAGAPAKRATPLRTVVLRKVTPGLHYAARSPRKTPVAKVAKVAKIQAPLELDPTKQAALMLMTGRTPKSKPPSLSPAPAPSYLVKRASPIRKTPQSIKKMSPSSQKTPSANGTPKSGKSPSSAKKTPGKDKTPKRQSRRSVRTREVKSDDETPRRLSGYEPHKSARSSRGSARNSVSILEISDTDHHRPHRSGSARGLGRLSPTLPSPKKSALKDPTAKNTTRKNESIKFDLSNLENFNDQSEVLILSHTTRGRSLSDGSASEEDLTLQYSDSTLPDSPSPRRSIHSRSSRILERSLGTSVESKNYTRTLTPRSPSARKSVRGSLMVEKVLESPTNESSYSRRATKSLDPDRTRTMSRSPRSKLEAYSIVDLVSINSSESRSSEYNSARSTRTTFATPDNRGRKTRSTIEPSLLLGSSTPVVQTSSNKNRPSGRNSAQSKRSLSLSTPKATKLSVSSKRSSSLSTPENTKPPVSIKTTRVSRLSRRTANDSDLLIISGDEDSPKTSKRNSRSSYKSIDMTTNSRNTSKSSPNTTRQSSKSPNVSSQSSTSPNSTRQSPNTSRHSSKSPNTTRHSTRSNADAATLSPKSPNTSRLSPKFPNTSTLSPKSPNTLTLSPKSPTASRLSLKSQNASRSTLKSPNASKLSLKFANTTRQSTRSNANASSLSTKSFSASTLSPKSPNVSVLSPKSPNSSKRSLKPANTSRQSPKSPNTSKVSSKSNTSRKSTRNLTLTIGPSGDGLHTPENRNSPEEISTPVLSIQSLLESSTSSLFSQVSTKRGRLSIKPSRKTIEGLRSQPKRGRLSSKSKSFHLGAARKSLLRHSKDSSEISDKTDDGAPKPSNEENITPKSTVKLVQEAVKNKHSTAKKPQSKRSIIDNLNESDLKDLFNSPVKRKLSQSMTEFSRTQLSDDEPAPKKRTRNTTALTGRSPEQSLLDLSENITPELFVSPLTTPGNSPDVSGVKKQFRKNTPRNDLSDVRGVKELLRGRKSVRTSVAGVKNLFAKSPNNNLTNVRGVKELFRSSPRNDLRRVTGVTSLYRTKGKGKSPKNDLANVQGVKKLFQKTSPENDLRNVSGLKNALTLRSPKNNLTDVRGVKQLFRRETSRTGLNDLSGVEELFNTSANSERNSRHDASMSELLFDEAFGKPKVKATYARSFTAKSAQRQKNQRSNKSLNVSFDLLTKGDSWLEKEAKKRKKPASPKAQNKSLNKSKHRELQKLSTDTVEGTDPLQKSRTRISTLIKSIPDVIQPKKSSSFNEKSLPIKKRSFVENSLEKSANFSKINLPIKKRALVHSTPVKGRWNMTANASELGRVSPIAAEKTSIDSDVTIRIVRLPASPNSKLVSPKPSRVTKSNAKAGTPHSLPKKRSTRASRVQKTPAKSPKATRGRKTTAAPEVTNTKRVRGSLVITLKSPKANPVATSPKASAKSEVTQSPKSPKALAKKAPKAPKAAPASHKANAKSPQAVAMSPKAVTKSPKPTRAKRGPKASPTSPKAAVKSPEASAKPSRAAAKKAPKSPRETLQSPAKPPRAVAKKAPKSPKLAPVSPKTGKAPKAKSPRTVAKKAPKAPKATPESPKTAAKSPKPQRGAPKSAPVSPKTAPKSARNTRAGPKSPKLASPKPPSPKQTRKTRKTKEASPKTSPKRLRTTRNRPADEKPATPKTKRGKISKNATLIIAKPSPQLKPQKKVNFSIEIEPTGRRGKKTREKSSPVENAPKRGRSKVESPPKQQSGNKPTQKVESPRPVKRGRKTQETKPKESPVKPKGGRNTTETSTSVTEPKGRKRRGAILDVEIPAKASRRGKAAEVETTTVRGRKSPAESPETDAGSSNAQSKAQKTKKTEAAKKKTGNQKEAAVKTTRGKKNQSAAEATLKGRKRKSDEASMSSSRGSAKKVPRTTRKTEARASPAKAAKAVATSAKAAKAVATSAKAAKAAANPAKATKAAKAKASPVKAARSTRRQANTSKAPTSASTRSRRK